MASPSLFVRLALVALVGGAAAAPPAEDPSRVQTSLAIPDIHGILQHPFAAPPGTAALVFFVTNDCPASNGYAPEIRNICESYKSKVRCTLAYVDPTLTNETVARHVADYKHGDYPAIVDAKHLLVKAAGATVTPEALLILPGGEIGYRGRVNDKYFSLGRARQKPAVQDLRDALDSFVAGKPILNKRTKAVGCYITPLELFHVAG